LEAYRSIITQSGSAIGFLAQMTTFLQSKTRYEDWMAIQLGPDLVLDDLVEKSSILKESAFVFLRGTYWRWAETILEIVQNLANAPQVLAVGDIHLENFGTWRDLDGRLIFGVNDFDEAAEMPYVLDLVRLATSALLGTDNREGDARKTCDAILAGYRKGLEAPSAIVLDQEWRWLRDFAVVAEARRQKFWSKIEAREKKDAPERFKNALSAAMPEQGLDFDTARRFAGTGSLGRPRWIGVANWRGGLVVREAKAVLTSGWPLARGNREAQNRSAEIARGRYRCPDPWYCVAEGIVVRRLSPNNRKVEADKQGHSLLALEMHEVMGRELASVHAGTETSGKGLCDTIRTDLDARPGDWLLDATTAAAEATAAEYKQWQKV
jgi:Uncharacterized protein conserved in bacteria (DUF2252)